MNTMKKILSVVLLAVFMFTMNLGMLDDFGVKEAKAVDTTYKITVKNTPASSGVSIAGKQYTAYKLFDVTTYDTTTGSYQYAVNAKFEGFTFTVDEATAVGAYKNGTEISSTNIIDYVKTCQAESTQLDAFAKKVLAWKSLSSLYENHAEVPASSESVDINLNGPNLGAGYYLVAGSSADAGDTSQEVVAACSLTTVAPTVTVNPKVDAPKLTKTITGVNKKGQAGVKGTTAATGDVIEFTLEGTVPNMKGYDTYKYVVHDTLSTGLTRTTTPDDLKVSINGKDVTTQFTIAGDNTFTISIANLKLISDIAAGQPIKITYTAKLNAIANNTNEETNEVSLEYSSNPSNPGTTVKTPQDKVYIHDFTIDVFKFTGPEETALAGAEFKLYKGSGATREYYNGVDELSGKIKWTKPTANDNSDNITYIGKTQNTTGKLDTVFKNLPLGTYYLEEVKAPDGYNLLDSSVKVVISDLAVGTDGTFTSVSYTVNSETPVVQNEKSYSVPVENAKGDKLPETGGIGTTIFYIVGGALMIGALVLLLTKKKMSSK